MSLDRDVADFLTSRTGEIAGAIERLDFIIIDFHVDPEGYREIGHMIRQGSITVETAQSSPGSGIEAVYTAGLNKLSVPANINLSEIGHQIKVIHEATHALIDFHNYQTTELVDEMA